ncbi:hypothetical protein Cni_G28756 [Canna indica]|uniref:RRM domain-containing protein n=1 Tax=Canna indica TaxID=4628 RepID=A0AAQ3L3K4_9LILI|nr:hypothetical protein Cni_G28756 [Canna indica]
MALPLLRLTPSPNPRSPLFFAASPSYSGALWSPICHSRFPVLLHRGSSTVAALSDGTTGAEIAESSVAAQTRLIAQNIPWTCTANDIRTLFAKHGNVVDVELSMYNSSRNRGLAFVTMASEEEALAALNNLNSYDFDGRIIKVEFARSVKKTPVRAASAVPEYNVFVGNLTWRVRSRDLRELFNASGNVLSAEVIYQTNPRRPAGYGFVSFSSKEEAEAAMSSLNGTNLMGRNIRLVLGNVQPEDAEKQLDTRFGFDLDLTFLLPYGPIYVDASCRSSVALNEPFLTTRFVFPSISPPNHLLNHLSLLLSYTKESERRRGIQVISFSRRGIPSMEVKPIPFSPSTKWFLDWQHLEREMLLGFDLSQRSSDLLQNCDLPPPLKLFSPVEQDDNESAVVTCTISQQQNPSPIPAVR